MNDQTTPPQEGNKPYVKMSEAVLSALEAAFRVDATITEACVEAGISRQTYYDHMADELTKWNGYTFKERIERAQAFPFLAAKKTLVKGIAAGNVKAALSFLSKRQRELYYEKQKNETNLTGGLDLLGIHNAAEAASKGDPNTQQPPPSPPNGEQLPSPASVPQVTATVRAGHVEPEAPTPQA